MPAPVRVYEVTTGSASSDLNIICSAHADKTVSQSDLRCNVALHFVILALSLATWCIRPPQNWFFLGARVIDQHSGSNGLEHLFLAHQNAHEPVWPTELSRNHIHGETKRQKKHHGTKCQMLNHSAPVMPAVGSKITMNKIDEDNQIKQWLSPLTPQSRH